MNNKYGELYSEMSNRAFHLYKQDLDSLKNLYGRSVIDLPRSFINKMKRAVLIEALLSVEYGTDATVEYLTQCKEWDSYKHYTEN